MNRVRIALAITMMLGCIYAAAGLLDSLTQFAIGVIVAASAVIGIGLCDWIEARTDNRIYAERARVWARRDGQP